MAPVQHDYHGKDRRHGFSPTFAELIAGTALIVTVLSAAYGWIVLPEQMRHVKDATMALDRRIVTIEGGNLERAETLARIDERTKRMEQTLATFTPKHVYP
jgi:hypothetical protein